MHFRPHLESCNPGYGAISLILKMVGARGFEPPTPWSRTRCATRLRYAPNLMLGGCRRYSRAVGDALNRNRLPRSLAEFAKPCPPKPVRTWLGEPSHSRLSHLA